MEVALDLALNASPDHPWVNEHPEWFSKRADGSIAYAENPPKKYQDIYNFNFDLDRDGIYAAWLAVVRLWMDHGVRIFRVDNPHTKPVSFWAWLLAEVRKTDPDVIFLAEAFTKPAMMHMLGKVGFQQSYTYFTWRNEKWEIQEYMEELTTEMDSFYRPNFFVNTPDILPMFLQWGGKTAFTIRAVLAATLSPTWGVYAGFELFENQALGQGREEYLDSEKFQYRPRDWAGAEASGENLNMLLGRLNQIRREHPALQQLRNLTFHRAPHSHAVVFSKREGDDVVIVVTSVDPLNVVETEIFLDMEALGLTSRDVFLVHDEITGQTWRWGQHAFVRLTHDDPCHVLTVIKYGQNRARPGTGPGLAVAYGSPSPAAIDRGPGPRRRAGGRTARLRDQRPLVRRQGAGGRAGVGGSTSLADRGRISGRRCGPRSRRSSTAPTRTRTRTRIPIWSGRTSSTS